MTVVDASVVDAPSPASVRRPCAKLAIVGAFDGTHIGASLQRAAMRHDIPTLTFDVSEASQGNRMLRAALWRLGDRRPPRLKRFCANVIEGCAEAKPELLIATGAAPLTRTVLGRLRAMGITCVNYSTDDPWNPAMRAQRHLRALPEYDVVFTTRRANLGCLRNLGCRDVRYLPFGYDEDLFRPPVDPLDGPAADVLFVGGADRDRAAFMSEFLELFPNVALVGSYWQRFRATRPCALGQLPPDALCALTAAAKVNLCLVRRANRDGHVMRSFEIAAIGGCMLAEDTAEHREIFGADGEAVAYFRTPSEAAARARSLVADPAERSRLSAELRARIASGRHTYRDRLLSMLAAAKGRGGCVKLSRGANS